MLFPGSPANSDPGPCTVLNFTSTVEYPVAQVQVNILPEYMDFVAIFSPTKATKLPPHCLYDCAVNIINGAILPKSRVYPLT